MRTILAIAVLTGLAPTGAFAEEVIRMDAVKVQGEIQKPQVAYIIPRSTEIDLSGDLQRLRPLQAAKYIQLVRGRETTFGRQARDLQ